MGGFLSDRQSPPVAPDPLNRRILSELNVFLAWCQNHNVRGYIGEIGWPNDSNDIERWNTLATRYFVRLAAADVTGSTWASGSVLSAADRLRYCYAAPGAVNVNSKSPAVTPCELYAEIPSTNLVGAAWARDTIGDGVFSNVNPGIAGVHYFYPSLQDLQFLAASGINLILFPFRLERLQPMLKGPLDSGELGRIQTLLARSATLGMSVLIEPHNFTSYYLGSNISTRENLILTTNPAGVLNTSHLVDLWTRISAALVGSGGLYAYDLMNEPAGMSNALAWETVSQACVDAIRGLGDGTLIMVPGYNYSRVATWTTNHPVPWITDSSNNFMYEGHHYWDKSNGGQYLNSYDNSNAAAGVIY